MRLYTFFWMMPHSISLTLFLLVFWLSLSLYISLSLSCPALVFFCLLLHKQTKTAISLHITLEENDGYFPRVSVFCTHFFFSSNVPQSACQSKVHYFSLKWTSVEFSSILAWKLSVWMTWIVHAERECIDPNVTDRSRLDSSE